MGQRYKHYLDVIKEINDFNLSKEEKEQEIERALTERNDDNLEMGWSKRQQDRMPPGTPYSFKFTLNIVAFHPKMGVFAAPYGILY